VCSAKRKAPDPNGRTNGNGTFQAEIKHALFRSEPVQFSLIMVAMAVFLGKEKCQGAPQLSVCKYLNLIQKFNFRQTSHVSLNRWL
jgi:hypothetical protein